MLREEFARLIAEYTPDVVAVEQVFFQVNVRTAMGVGQASGLALAEAAHAGCDVVQYTPNQVKDAVAGWGAAPKEQVQRMVKARLGLSALPQPADAADAAALALCHLAMAPMQSGDRGCPMIGSLRGEVLERWAEGTVLVDVGGVGYEVIVSPRTFGELEPTTPAFLYIHHHIREDDQTLYGFLTRDERSTFKTLIATHGVGPALAMAILATFPPVRPRRRRRQRRFRRIEGGSRGRPEDGTAAARRVARPPLRAGARRVTSAPRAGTGTSTVGAVREALGRTRLRRRRDPRCRPRAAGRRRRGHDAARRAQAARSQACVTSSSIPASTTTPRMPSKPVCGRDASPSSSARAS